jgi:predicted O-methyltransferase YrrM
LDYEYELVKGDISETFPQYLETRPGMKISMLFIDLDLEKPTYDVLCHAWDRVSKGGIVVFDEYGLHQWSECRGADRFFKGKDVEVKSLNYIGAMAYVKKKEF